DRAVASDLIGAADGNRAGAVDGDAADAVVGKRQGPAGHGDGGGGDADAIDDGILDLVGAAECIRAFDVNGAVRTADKAVDGKANDAADAVERQRHSTVDRDGVAEATDRDILDRAVASDLIGAADGNRAGAVDGDAADAVVGK